MRENASFTEEIHISLVKGLPWAAGLVAFAFTAFALVDPFFARDEIAPFIRFRAIIVAVALLILVASLTPPGRGKRAIRLLGYATITDAGFGVSYLTYMTGGSSSPYWVFLMLTFFGGTMLLRFSALEATLLYGVQIAIYVAVILGSGESPESASFVTSVGGLGVALIVAVTGNWYIRHLQQNEFAARAALASANAQLTETVADLQIARRQSDQLLLNILPKPIADELKKNGTVEPVEHNSVTVVFTDFVNFTASSEGRNPKDLLHDLDDCFSAFDAIIEKYGLEKLKTIGDAYMFAGGVPRDLSDNAVRCVLAAKEIIAYVERRRAEDPSFWQIRVGVHTGNLIAGVIGRKKFIYDVWGDTVNTASRLEAAGEPGRINTSAETYRLISDRFSCTARGEIPVKGKGPLAMYFVE
jgi:class 3 adenylate cyclase